VRALYRRADVTAITSAHTGGLSHGNLHVDLRHGSAKISNEKLPLTTTEFRFLVELLSQPNKVLSREYLISEAMGGEHVTNRTVDVHMAGLRKKLGSMSNHITTARGVGYRFSTDI